MLKSRVRNFLGKHLGIYKDHVPEGFHGINRSVPDKHLPEDVFFVAYPKSGMTWFQYLVCGLVYGVNPSMCPSELVNDLIPDVHYSRFYRRYATPMFFKSHSLPRREYRRIVYLLRDGRDVMVSFKHYQEAAEGTSVDFLKFVTSEEMLSPCKWHRHVEEWTMNPFDAEILVIKYEDLLEQPVAQLERFCDFVKLPKNQKDMSAVVEAARFQHLKERDWTKGKYFFRRGVAGSHKDEMPPKVLEAFLRDASETLRRHGYPLGQSSFGVAPGLAGT